MFMDDSCRRHWQSASGIGRDRESWDLGFHWLLGVHCGISLQVRVGVRHEKSMALQGWLWQRLAKTILNNHIEVCRFHSG